MAKKQESKIAEEGNIEEIGMSIIDEGNQLSIRIPAKVREALQIDPKKDIFLFVVDKKNLHLGGFLVDKETYQKEKEIKLP